jgi:cytochrome c-type biogenesis protein CcmF
VSQAYTTYCNLFLTLNIFTCFLGLFFLLKNKNYSCHVSAANSLFISACFLILISAFLTDNFDFELVLLNSSTKMPNLYKISTIWSSYEGSMLLFLFFICFFTTIFAFQNKELNNKPDKEINKEINCQLKYFFSSQYLIISAISLFVLFFANPFTKSKVLHGQGLGMNPLLQDVAVGIHPPIMYIGYALSSLIFSASIEYIVNPIKNNLKIIVNYSRLYFIFLSLAITLGSWWAYRELGWGGFWFFDPVENLSLVPLFFSVAYHHSLLISIKQNRFIKWTIFFGIFNFAFLLFAIFLIRSGLLVSVHSFAFDYKRSYVFGFTLLLFFIFCTIYYSFGIRKIVEFNASVAFNSKENGIFLSNIFFLILVFIIIISSVYPIFSEILTGQSVVVEESFFIKFFTPLFIPIILIANLAYANTLKNKKILFILSILMPISILFFVKCSLISSLFLLCSLMLSINTLSNFLIKTSFLRGRLTKSIISMSLGHLSLCILTLSIVGNSIYGFNFDFDGKVGSEIKNEKMKVNLSDLRYARSANYLKQVSDFRIDYLGNIVDLKPEIRFYEIENRLTSDPDIYSFLFYDIYAVINSIDENESVNATIYYRPFVSQIWFSIAILILGLMCGFERKNK